MQIPLTGQLVERPRRTLAEGPLPIVRRPRRIERVRIPPDIPVAMGTGPGAPGVLEPGVPVARVVRHPVEEHADRAVVGVGKQRVERVEITEEGIYPAVVGHVVAEVGHRRRVDRRKPDGIGA